MSLIVPWTDPGGTPCCCTPPLPTCPNLGNGPTGVEYATATRFAIDADTYANLYAGGVMTLSITGNVDATAVSVFNNNQGNPVWECRVQDAGSGDIDFVCPPNICRTFNNNKSDGKVQGTYNHFLEGNPDLNTFSVFFELRGSFSSGENCGIGQASGAVARNITYNGGVPPLVTGAGLATRFESSISVNLGNGTVFSVPAYDEAFTTVLFFSYYTDLSGSSSLSVAWTPNAP